MIDCISPARAVRFNVFPDAAGHFGGAAAACPEYLEPDGGQSVDSGFHVLFSEGLPDVCHLLQRHCCPVRTADQDDIAERFGPFPVLGRAQADKPGIGPDRASADLDGRRLDPPGHRLPGQSIPAQGFLGHVNTDFRGTHPLDHHSGYGGHAHQIGADLSCQAVQHVAFQPAVEKQGQDLYLFGGDGDHGFLGLRWKRRDPVDFAFNVIEHGIGIGPLAQFGNDPSPAAVSGAPNGVDPVHTPGGGFQGKQHPFFHVLRSGPGIGHHHADHIQFGIGKHFPLNGGQADQPAGQKKDHEQVGGDRIAQHPCHHPFGTVFRRDGHYPSP